MAAATWNLFWVHQHPPQQTCKPCFSTNLSSSPPTTPSFTKPKSYPSLKASVLLNPQSPIALTVDCNDKIRELCEMGSLREAVQSLSASPKSEIDLNTYCLLLQLCAEQRSLKHGRRVHSVISSNGFLSDNETDGGFGVLVPCYGSKNRDAAGVTNKSRARASDALDSKKYMEQWLSSLQSN